MRFDLKRLLLAVTLACVTAAILGTRGWVGAVFACFLWATLVGVAAYRPRSGLLAVLALVMFLAGMLALPIAFMEGHPVPLSRLGRVQPGMTQRQVQQAIGLPTSAEGGRWTYDSDWTWCYITVVFSDNGRVKEVVHDH